MSVHLIAQLQMALFQGIEIDRLFCAGSSSPANVNGPSQLFAAPAELKP